MVIIIAIMFAYLLKVGVPNSSKRIYTRHFDSVLLSSYARIIIIIIW